MRHPRPIKFPHPHPRKDFTHDLNTWMCQVGLKRLNDMVRDNTIDTVTHETHKDWLIEETANELQARGLLTDYDEHRTGNMIDAAWIEREAKDVAGFNFQADPKRFLESAAKGGRKSKRKPTLDHHLLTTPALVNLSIEQQARFLGVGPATVSRMRARLKAEEKSEIEKQELLRALLPE